MTYGLGDVIEVTIDNSHVIHTLAPCSKHRVDRLQVLKGTVVGQPNWLKGPHICLLNSDNKVLNYIPEHRVVSVNDKPVVQKTKSRDRVFNITSSKTGEAYIVRLNGMTRLWSCTCTGFNFHKKCRHTVKCEHEAEKIVVDRSN